MRAETPRERAPRLPLPSIIGYCLVWLSGVLFVGALVLAGQLRQAENEFDAQAQTIFASIEGKLRVNSAVLDGLAAYLRVAGDRDQARLGEYVRHVLSGFPHIYMAQVQRRVPHERLAQWQRELRAAGAALTLHGAGGQHVPAKASYLPVVLSVPERRETGYFRGLDLDEVDFLRDTAARAQRQDKAVTSPAFEFVPGDLGFAVIRPAHRLGERDYGQLTAAVFVRASDLMPPARRLPAGMELTLWHSEHAGGSYRLSSANPRPLSALETRLFPRLQMARSFTSDTQPLSLAIAQPLGWWAIDPWLALAFVLISLLGLAALLVYGRGRYRRQQEQRDASQRLYRLANYDTLTELPNRNLLSDRVEQALSRARRGQTSVALCFLDLDGFKAVNDTAGHDAGDTLLKQVAERLRGAVREQDTVARLGGDEFVIVLENVKARADAERVMALVHDAFIQSFEIGTFEFMVSASIGLAMFPEDGQEALELLRAADGRMYEVKHPEWEHVEAVQVTRDAAAKRSAAQ